MLRIYRRHLGTCQHSSERYRRCSCPISVEGSLAGEDVRTSLDLTSWEAASDLVAKWNASRQIGVVRVEIPPVTEAEWVRANHVLGVKPPKVTPNPTLPFTREDMRERLTRQAARIRWAN